jgi:hypothetical protein
MSLTRPSELRFFMASTNGGDLFMKPYTPDAREHHHLPLPSEGQMSSSLRFEEQAG